MIAQIYADSLREHMPEDQDDLTVLESGETSDKFSFTVQATVTKPCKVQATFCMSL